MTAQVGNERWGWMKFWIEGNRRDRMIDQLWSVGPGQSTHFDLKLFQLAASQSSALIRKNRHNH
jgi:hypothetical protein